MNKWLGVEPHVLTKIKDLVKILHEASLLIDDIQDDSKMRRGQPAAYLIYGVSEVRGLVGQGIYCWERYLLLGEVYNFVKQNEI